MTARTRTKMITIPVIETGSIDLTGVVSQIYTSVAGLERFRVHVYLHGTTSGSGIDLRFFVSTVNTNVYIAGTFHWQNLVNLIIQCDSNLHREYISPISQNWQWVCLNYYGIGGPFNPVFNNLKIDIVGIPR